MIIDDIALTMHPEVGPRTAIHLLECFGTAERIFAATEQELIERTGIRPAVARSLSRREYHPAADRELQFVSEYGSGTAEGVPGLSACTLCSGYG